MTSANKHLRDQYAGYIDEFFELFLEENHLEVTIGYATATEFLELSPLTDALFSAWLSERGVRLLIQKINSPQVALDTLEKEFKIYTQDFSKEIQHLRNSLF